MLSNERQGHWSTILDMTRDLASLAEDEAWDKLAQLEAQRRCRLAEFFATPVTPEEAATLATGLQELLDIDRRVMTRVLAARDQVGASLRSLYTGRQANQAYAKASA